MIEIDPHTHAITSLSFSSLSPVYRSFVALRGMGVIDLVPVLSLVSAHTHAQVSTPLYCPVLPALLLDGELPNGTARVMKGLCVCVALGDLGVNTAINWAIYGGEAFALGLHGKHGVFAPCLNIPL
jgi:hypothetical protein